MRIDLAEIPVEGHVHEGGGAGLGPRIEFDLFFDNQPVKLRQPFCLEGLVVKVAGETRRVEQVRHFVGAELRDARATEVQHRQLVSQIQWTQMPPQGRLALVGLVDRVGHAHRVETQVGAVRGKMTRQPQRSQRRAQGEYRFATAILRLAHFTQRNKARSGQEVIRAWSRNAPEGFDRSDHRRTCCHQACPADIGSTPRLAASVM